MRNRYAGFSDQVMRHLDMIQAVVARLGNDSFLIKGWTLTVAGAFFGFAVTTTRSALAWMAIVPVGLFWLLDVHFLRAERLFRVLYDYVRSDDPDVAPFFMAPTSKTFVKRVRADKEREKNASWWNTFRRPTLLFYYGTLVLVALGLVFLIHSHSPILKPQITHAPSP